MKIVVINYDELNKRPSNEQVMNDICRLYLSSSSECLEDMGKLLREQLDTLSNANNVHKKNDNSVIFMNTSDLSSRYALMQFVNDNSPDLLVSYNLAGFELDTLADSLLYNLINCRQFHIIKRKGLPNEKYLDKLLSFNLFLFNDYQE